MSKTSCLLLFTIFFIVFELHASDIILPAEDLYRNSLIKIKEKNYSKASLELRKLILQHPFSELALKSEIMLAYIALKKKDYDEIIAVLENYLKHYTYNTSKENLDYIYYMLTVAYFHNMKMNIMDLDYINATYETFNNLSQRIENPEYIADVKLKFTIINETLAERIYNIGMFYAKKLNIDAALYRFERIFIDHNTTSYYCKTVEQMKNLHKKYDFNIEKYNEHIRNCNPIKIDIANEDTEE